MGNQERALSAVESLNSEGNDFSVTFVHSDFMDGSLYVVEFFSASDRITNWVYIAGKELNVIKNPALLVEFVARKTRRLGLATTILKHTGGIAGLIALIITISICYMFVFRENTEIPDVLSAALTTVLGFYFGSKTTT